MKKNTRMILVIFIMTLIKPLISQQYFTFPIDTATWSETCGHFETYPYPHWEYYTIRYFLDGDTTIDSIVYSKIYGYFGANIEVDTLYSDLLGGLREDSLKQIYFLPFPLSQEWGCYHCNLYPFPPEYLLYRFDLVAGDTAFVGPTNSFYGGFIVSSIDSILIDASYRKRYNMNPIYGDGYQHWIEGIGSDLGLFGPSCDPFEGNVELLCYQDQYTDYSKYGYCYEWFYVSVPEKQEKIVFTISPNPAKTKIMVSLQGTELQETTLKAVDIFGQEVWHETITSGSTKHEINMNNWEPGIYVFSLYRKGELLQIQKLVVVK